MTIDSSRRGYIELTGELIKVKPEIISTILSNVLVTDVNYDVSRNTYKYRGYSQYFDPVPEGQFAPGYDFIEEDGKLKVRKFG